MMHEDTHANIPELGETAVRRSRIGGFSVVTDRVAYGEVDMVMPLHAENYFVANELRTANVAGQDALVFGLGSGVDSILLAQAGAASVTSLEINERAKRIGAYNLQENGADGIVAIVDGDAQEVWAPVRGKQFGYFTANPPFEPTPPSSSYFTHSAAGVYGLDVFEKIVGGLDEHLAADGHAQIVMFAPGDATRPFLLEQMVEKHLPNGAKEIVVNPIAMRYDAFVDRFVSLGVATQEQVEAMKAGARRDGVSHLHLCMLHYAKGEGARIEVTRSAKTYDHWDIPAGSDVPMGTR